MAGLRFWGQQGVGARHAGIGLWVRVALAVVCAAAFVVTLAWPDWIEIVLRVDPDHGSGWLEWAIVIVAFALMLTFSVGVRREWRRSVTTTVSDGACRAGLRSRMPSPSSSTLFPRGTGGSLPMSGGHGVPPGQAALPDNSTLTGIWLADDEGVYFLRQIGVVLWWLGLSAGGLYPGLQFCVGGRWRT